MANTVLVMSDEHNPFYASPYGHPFIQTPHMARLAKEGTLFQNAYCPSPLRLPRRSAFMFGLRAHQLQTYSNCTVNLNTGFLSYGRALKEQGVHTVHIGKVDVYDKGENLGFSDIILPGDRKMSGDNYFSRRPLAIRKKAAKRMSGYGPREEEAACMKDMEKTDAAIHWLSTKGVSLKTPWVLSLNLSKSYFPHTRPPAFWHMYEGNGGYAFLRH